MSHLTYLEVVKQIESLGIMPNQAPSLDPMKQGLSRIFPDEGSDLEKIPKEKIIVVAGTNGKGSVCATLEALLLHAGQSVGMYTSPHLEETTERIRINGEDISEENFVSAYREVHKKTSDIQLSHFETLTLIAAWVFFSQQSPYQFSEKSWFIFEVGLGGTWDATNAIPHQYNVITTLGLDHQNLLGNSIESIASNKFGVIQSKTQVVYSPLPKEVEQLARETQKKTQTQWTPSLPFELSVRNQATHQDPLFVIQTPWGEAPLTLPGWRGAQNTATALTVFQKLGFNPTHHLSALKKVRWPGRMEFSSHPNLPCRLYFSGDHNPAGLQSLIELLSYYQWDHLHILAGIGKDKDLEGILSPLSVIKNSSLYLTETPFKGRPLESYETWLNRAAGHWHDPRVALKTILQQANSKDMILVTGSLYLVGLLKKNLRDITSPSCLDPITQSRAL